MARGACDEGVGTTTIGFGEGFDEELLTRVADVAAGNAYFAGSPEEAPGIFAQEFEGLTPRLGRTSGSRSAPPPTCRCSAC